MNSTDATYQTILIKEKAEQQSRLLNLEFFEER